MIQDTPQHCGEPKLVVETAVKKTKKTKEEKNEIDPSMLLHKYSFYMFVTITITPQSIYALVLLNENGKVAG